MLPKSYTLNNGVTIPAVALGTYKSLGDDVRAAVKTALRCGYTSIDTASFYGNEADVRRGIQDAGCHRGDVFVTSKLWNDDHGYDAALRAFDRSEKNLDGIDLYLIHWPGRDRYVETWQALQRIYREGRVKAIGVSNFLPHHIKALLAQCDVVPAVNQVEAHPSFLDDALQEYCAAQGILMEAWRPLSYDMGGDVVVELAEKYGRTPAQIILHYMVARGYRVLPKSVTPARIASNLDITSFTLSNDDMGRLAALNTGVRRGNDPDTFVF
ncbi:MAG: aldo/keto reductase [Eubacteriales bacterium]|nr:aldo/keto reductase [Eubacteriales bacterium]